MDQAFHGNGAFHVESEALGEMPRFEKRFEKKRMGKRMGVCVSCCCISKRDRSKRIDVSRVSAIWGGIKSRDVAKTGPDIWEKWAIL